jgi:hypothetical protein
MPVVLTYPPPSPPLSPGSMRAPQAAMMTLPYREDFIVSVGQGSKEGVMDNFVRCSAVMETLRTSLWAFFRKHEAHELP